MTEHEASAVADETTQQVGTEAAEAETAAPKRRKKAAAATEDHPSLFQPAVPERPLVDDPGDLWIRIERETLRRLPRSGGVLFTIRGFQQPLRDYVRRGRHVATNLHRLVSRLPDDVARYKSIYPYRDAVLSWLDGVVDDYPDEGVS